MPFCPQCGYEYREGADLCPDCNQPLAAEAPKEPHATTAGWPAANQAAEEQPARLPEGLVAAYEAPDPVFLGAVADALQGAGIPVEEVPLPRAAGYAPAAGEAAFQHWLLLVPEARAEEAKGIVGETLAAYEQGDLALTQEETVSPMSPWSVGGIASRAKGERVGTEDALRSRPASAWVGIIVGGILIAYGLWELARTPALLTRLGNRGLPWLAWIAMGVGTGSDAGLLIGGVCIILRRGWGMRVAAVALAVQLVFQALAMAAMIFVAAGLAMFPMQSTAERWTHVPPAAQHSMWWMALILFLGFEMLLTAAMLVWLLRQLSAMKAGGDDGQTAPGEGAE